MFDISELPRPLIRYGVGIWRRRWIVIAVTWLAALAGWFGVWLLPDQYESRAQVNVRTETILEPVMNGVMARPNYEDRVEVMTLQLLTRPNVEEIIYRAGLDKDIDARNPVERRAQMEGMINWVAGDIEISNPRDLYFMISYRHGDPEIARNVVDAVLNLLIEQDLGASLTEKENAVRLLDQQIAQYDARLTAKEQEVAEFRRQHAEELAIVEGTARRRDQMETDLVRIADLLSQEQRRVATLRNLMAATPRASAGNELDQLKVELAQLRSQYEEGHPDIQGLVARIEQLENSGAGALPDNPEFIRLRNELRSAEAAVADLEVREERARAELDALALKAGEAPAVQAELLRIERDYQQTQKSYEELVARRDRLMLTTSLGAGGQGVEYQIFERPTVALKPVSPPRQLLILASLVFAFGAGCAVAMLFTFLDKSYTQTADLQKAFALPVLGSIGPVSSDYQRALARSDRLKLAAACLALAVLAGVYIYLSVVRLPDSLEDGARTASAATSAETQSWD